MRKRWVAATWTAAWAACGMSFADFVTPTSQSRSVEGTCEVIGPELSDNDYQFSSAPDFGPYSDSVLASASVTPFSATASGVQNSAILGNGMFGTGSAAANCTGGATTFSSAEGSSFFSVTFTLNSNADYTLTGSISSAIAGGSGGGGAGLALYDSLANVVESIEVNDSGFDSILASGSLSSGTYTMLAFANSSASADFANTNSSASADYEFDLTFTPEPASLLLLGFSGLLLARRR